MGTVDKKDIDNKWTYRLYITLIVLRLGTAPFLPGYIHPDEFFQGGQELWFGCPPTIPWEFEPRHALRSVVPPAILTRFPIYAYSLARGISPDSLSGWEILILPRVFCALLSLLCVDRTVWLLSGLDKKSKSSVPAPSLALASAWPVWAMLSRPFSNSMETCILALLFRVIFLMKPGIVQSMVIGALVAFGFFTRFTFVFFALPIGVWHLWSIFTQKERTTCSKGFSIILTIISFSACCTGIVLADSVFYGKTNYGVGDSHLVVTPWNAFEYNSKTDNLKDHGIHPRWTHSVVNMLLLFGPLTVVSYLSMVSYGESRSKAEGTTAPALSQVRTLYKSTIISGLFFLSIAPHQEPRFLLPLVFPVILLGSDKILESRFRVSLWISFNIILLVLFGGLHQSGVIPTLLSLSQILGVEKLTSPSAIIFSHTYMPPTFLARVMSSRALGVCDITDDSVESHGLCNAYDAPCTGIPITDLAGQDFDSLGRRLGEILNCSNNSSSDQSSHLSAILVVPTLVSEAHDWQFGDHCTIPGFRCSEVDRYWPHLTTEDIPPFDGSVTAFVSSLSLHVYDVRCHGNDFPPKT